MTMNRSRARSWQPAPILGFWGLARRPLAPAPLRAKLWNWPALLFWLGLLSLVGCAGPTAAVRADWPADDARFGAAPVLPDAAQVLAIDAPMRAYIAQRLQPVARRAGGIHALPNALLDALFEQGELQLDYDDRFTRSASEAFAARRGNCLSLVLMTTAFAREMGLDVEFNEALIDEPWRAEHGLLLRTGHVNLSLVVQAAHFDDRVRGRTMVDFLPGLDLERLRVRRIDQARLMAMFFNNRAAEALVADDLAGAYWHAREALRHDPGFATAGNTLGVALLRAGALAPAAQAFEQVLRMEPVHVGALVNLAQAEQARGHWAVAAGLRERLAQLERTPPAALAQARAQDPAARAAADSARRLLGAAVLASQQGDLATAQRHIEAALALAPPAEQLRYAGKLARLRAAMRSGAAAPATVQQ